MHYQTILLIFLLISSPAFVSSQIDQIFDDFEGNGNIPSWTGDDCSANTSFANPQPDQGNPSATVLRYQDTGGQYANVRFDLNDNLDLSTNFLFSLHVYVPAAGLTGNQNNQISLKLQNGDLAEPWTTQSEIIKSLSLDQWQTVTFNFRDDNFINLDPGSPLPTMRSDFNRVVIQINGENNNDQVLAYLDNVQLTAATTGGGDPVYNNLVWSDEFDTPGPINSDKWFHQTIIPNGDSWFNGEIQHYTDELDNSFVADGLLKIVARRQNYTDQGVTKQFTSARLNSKFAFTYGRVEIRAKLPTGVGTWPALWTLGKNITETGAYWQTQGFGTTGWPACGELDIMEHWGANQNYVSSAIHTPSSFGATVNVGGRVIPGVSDEFHDYSMIWSPEKVVFKVDGITHYTYEPDIQNPDTWPFDADQYLLLNVAVLPSIAANFTQSALEIDYVRVYQEGPASLARVEAATLATAFPNPFTESVTVQTDLPSGEHINVEVYSMNGRLLKILPAQSDDGKLNLSNLGDLPMGNYVLFFQSGGNAYQCSILRQ